MSTRNAGRSLVAAAAAMLFFAFPAAAAPGLTDCKCADLRAMRDRWCSARAARAEYERIERYLIAESAKTGTRMLSPDDKRKINQECVQEVVNLASDQGVVKATGVTTENRPWDTLAGEEECRVSITSPTGCLKQIVAAHEGHHSDECGARTAMWQSIPIPVKPAIQAFLYGASSTAAMTITGDTKFSLTSAQFASEEAASYTIEIQLISAKWKELQKTCNSLPGGDFDAVLADKEMAGENFWNKLQPEANGTRIYKMYSLSIDPCPSRPPKSPSVCTLR